MAVNTGWQGRERRTGVDRRTMLIDRPEQERRVAERRSHVGADDDRIRSEGRDLGQARSGRGANPADGIG